ncbi:hypothetical protein TcWFU_002447 [Taenia crassiceps]|uniref:Uncharacterized protein n=1 Tax=Taenia crassiceps TaxID=6207 RepID=A0ABR4QFW9_9CEST
MDFQAPAGCFAVVAFSGPSGSSDEYCIGQFYVNLKRLQVWPHKCFTGGSDIERMRAGAMPLTPAKILYESGTSNDFQPSVSRSETSLKSQRWPEGQPQPDRTIWSPE